MRLVTFMRLGEARLGAVVGDQVIDLNAVYHMKHGVVVRSEIEGLGALENPVAAAEA